MASGVKETPGTVVAATLQVIGGAWGAVVLATVCPLFQAQVSAGTSGVAVSLTPGLLLNLGLWALFETLFASSVLAGVLLFRRRRAGAWLTCILEVLQVPWINLPAFSYRFVVGLALPIGVLLPGLHGHVGCTVGGDAQVWFKQLSEPASCELNLLALGLALAALLWATSPGDDQTTGPEPQGLQDGSSSEKAPSRP